MILTICTVTIFRCIVGSVKDLKLDLHLEFPG